MNFGKLTNQLRAMDEKWITIGGESNPHKVLLNDDGTIKGGSVPKSLQGKTLGEGMKTLKEQNKGGGGESAPSNEPAAKRAERLAGTPEETPLMKGFNKWREKFDPLKEEFYAAGLAKVQNPSPEASARRSAIIKKTSKMTKKMSDYVTLMQVENHIDKMKQAEASGASKEELVKAAGGYLHPDRDEISSKALQNKLGDFIERYKLGPEVKRLSK